MAKWAEIKCERCAEQDDDFFPAAAGDDPIWLGGVEYITRKRSDDLVQAAVAAKLREAAEAVEDYCSDAPDLAGHGHSVGIRDAIFALIREGGE